MGKKYNKKWEKKVCQSAPPSLLSMRIFLVSPFCGRLLKGSPDPKGTLFWGSVQLPSLDFFSRGYGSIERRERAFMTRTNGEKRKDFFWKRPCLRGKHNFFSAQRNIHRYFLHFRSLLIINVKRICDNLSCGLYRKSVNLLFSRLFPTCFDYPLIPQVCWDLRRVWGPFFSLLHPFSGVKFRMEGGRGGENICKRKEGGRIGGGGTIQLQKVTMVRDSPTKNVQ